MSSIHSKRPSCVNKVLTTSPQSVLRAHSSPHQRGEVSVGAATGNSPNARIWQSGVCLKRNPLSTPLQGYVAQPAIRARHLKRNEHLKISCSTPIAGLSTRIVQRFVPVCFECVPRCRSCIRLAAGFRGSRHHLIRSRGPLRRVY